MIALLLKENPKAKLFVTWTANTNDAEGFSENSDSSDDVSVQSFRGGDGPCVAIHGHLS